MNNQTKSCAVADPTQCNHATTYIEIATIYATNNATEYLMSLVGRLAERNSATECATRSATYWLQYDAQRPVINRRYQKGEFT